MAGTSSQHLEVSGRDKLLDTKIILLGMGKNFNNHFTQTITKKTIKPEDIFTLREFIQENHEVLKKSEFLICYKDGHKLMSQASTMFKVFVAFLKEKGFTEQDWSLLNPANASRSTKNFKAFKKEQLRRLDCFTVCGMARNSFTGDCIARLLECRTVEQLLQITQQSLLNVFFTKELSLSKFFTVQTSLKKAQKKLNLLGFTGDDGPFMNFPQKSLGKKDLRSTSDIFIMRLNGQMTLFHIPLDSSNIKPSNPIPTQH